MTDAAVFDRRLLAARRLRLARRAHRTPSDAMDADFLFQEAAERMMDRLDDVSRNFPLALDLGSRHGALTNLLRYSGKSQSVFSCDLVQEFGPDLVVNEEQLPFAPASFDLIVSNLVLHWVNDLPGTLIQINRSLKPDGLFQAVLLGGETLTELRDCLMQAELDVTGGASPRVSPMVDLRDAAGLLQRAGFALPVADLDRVNVTYENAFRLMADLRGMGEANAAMARIKTPTRRAVFLRAADIYQNRYSNADGRIEARFDMIFLHGWRPSDNQPKALKPGSAVSRLADALGGKEEPL